MSYLRTPYSYILVVLVSVYGVHSATLFAEELATSTTTTTEAVQMNPPEIQQSAVRENRTTTITRAFQDRIINLIRNIQTRLSAAIERMDNIITRLESRMTKMKSLGIDTTFAESKLSLAKESSLRAHDALTSALGTETSIRSATPQETFETIRIQLIETRDHIRQTYALLEETSSALREAMRAGSTPQTPPEATTTSENNAQATTTP
jgi:hypothetical protein